MEAGWERRWVREEEIRARRGSTSGRKMRDKTKENRASNFKRTKLCTYFTARRDQEVFTVIRTRRFSMANNSGDDLSLPILHHWISPRALDIANLSLSIPPPRILSLSLFPPLSLSFSFSLIFPPWHYPFTKFHRSPLNWQLVSITFYQIGNEIFLRRSGRVRSTIFKRKEKRPNEL